MIKKLAHLRYCILTGAVLGWVSYFIIVWISYANYKSSILNATTFKNIIAQDAGMGGAFLEGDLSKERLKTLSIDPKRTYWRILVNLDVIKWDSDLPDVGDNVNNALDIIGVNDLMETKTINFVATFPGKIGANHTLGADPQVIKSISNIIAECLSGAPKAYERYQESVTNQSSNIPSQNFLAFAFPKTFFPAMWGRPATANDVLLFLFTHYRVGEKFDQLPESGKSNSNLTLTDEYRQIQEFALRMLLSVKDDPKVVSAKNVISIVEGPEQLLMYIVFFIGLLLLIRKFYTNAPENKNELLRFNLGGDKLLDWTYATLPALGFIGTIRGLGTALGQADKIIRAGSTLNQSISISEITAILGIAFTTTLVALVLGLLLKLVELALELKPTPVANEQI